MSFDGNMRLILHDADADAGDELQISTLGLMKNFLWLAVGNFLNWSSKSGKTCQDGVISHVPMFHITQPLGIWSTRWLLFLVMSNSPKSWDIYQSLPGEFRNVPLDAWSAGIRTHAGDPGQKTLKPIPETTSHLHMAHSHKYWLVNSKICGLGLWHVSPRLVFDPQFGWPNDTSHWVAMMYYNVYVYIYNYIRYIHVYIYIYILHISLYKYIYIYIYILCIYFVCI